MITFRRPSTITIQSYLAEQCGLPFTYEAVGATGASPPPGFDVDRTAVRLGRGGADFEAACRALRGWRQFDLGWVTARPPETPIEAGEVIAVSASKFGLTWINACRIVYVVDDELGSRKRFGFAYGTLPGHVESGEERFLVEWDRQTDEVTYSILAFSRPRHWTARLGYPLMRRSQRRFARDSAAAMQAAVRQTPNGS